MTKDLLCRHICMCTSSCDIKELQSVNYIDSLNQSQVEDLKTSPLPSVECTCYEILTNKKLSYDKCKMTLKWIPIQRLRLGGTNYNSIFSWIKRLAFIATLILGVFSVDAGVCG